MATAVQESRPTQNSGQTDFLTIPLKQLHESKTNPRRTFEPKALAELTASVREKGVLVPILTRPTGWTKIDGADPEYEVVAGARRFRAAKEAGLVAMPCIVRELDDRQALEIQVIENLQRADIQPIEEAEGYKRLMETAKYDVATIAKKVGKSKEYIYARLKLAELIPPAKEALLQEKITPGHAILIARLQPKDQQTALEQCAPNRQNDDPLSVRGLSEWIEEAVHLELKRAPWKLDDAALLAGAGACITCEKKAKDCCLDAECYERKLTNHLVGLEAKLGGEQKKVVRISGEYYTRGSNGPLGSNNWKKAESGSCKHIVTGLVVQSGYGHDVKRGQVLTICSDQRCKEHWPSGHSNSSVSTKTPAQKAAERKDRAIGEARTAASGAIAGAAKWPLNVDQVRNIALAFLERTTHDATKLLCKALGIWPKDGKTGGFDFKQKAKAFIKESDNHRLAGILIALSLMPTWGRWGGGYYGAPEETKTLYAVGREFHIDIPKLEREQIAAANEKAAKRNGKLQTSAKSKTKAKKLKKAS